MTFSADMRAPALQHLWDHRVQGQALAPAAMLLEIAACASCLLTGNFLSNFLLWRLPESTKCYVHMTPFRLGEPEQCQRGRAV